MPYKDISELPKAQVDQYDRHQKEAFLKAFNKAYEEYGGTSTGRSPSPTCGKASGRQGQRLTTQT
jgi:cation transport regulator